MDFDKSKVYTALNADKLKVGSKCIFANNLDSLKCKVEEGTDIRPIVQILNDAYERRFKTDTTGVYPFAYLISEPELNWIVYLHRRAEPYLTACRSDVWESVKEKNGAKTKLFEGTEDESDKWYEARRDLTDVIAAWEDGKDIEFHRDKNDKWITVYNPSWDLENEYRIKPESLKWTDLKIGDVIRNESSTHTMMVIGIDSRNDTKEHIMTGECWLDNDDLEFWEKVERD